mmetsp:Transcript_85044/g.186720  ORF Transcript_85044/g.186720 Transcript_85044/m.186720 type:complete len:108 (-) Transcript_85044:263-586(-)
MSATTRIICIVEECCFAGRAAGCTKEAAITSSRSSFHTGSGARGATVPSKGFEADDDEEEEEDDEDEEWKREEEGDDEDEDDEPDEDAVDFDSGSCTRLQSVPVAVW